MPYLSDKYHLYNVISVKYRVWVYENSITSGRYQWNVQRFLLSFLYAQNLRCEGRKGRVVSAGSFIQSTICNHFVAKWITESVIVHVKFMAVCPPTAPRVTDSCVIIGSNVEPDQEKNGPSFSKTMNGLVLQSVHQWTA